MFSRLFSRKPSPQNSAPKPVQEALRNHDATRIAQLQRRLATLPWGPEALDLGRALAAYSDQLGRRQEAAARYRALLRQAEAHSDSQAKATLLLDLAELDLRWSDKESADDHLQAAQSEPATRDDPLLQARLLRTQAERRVDRRDFDEAQRAANRALALCTKAKNWPGQAASLNALAYVANSAGNFEAAFEHTTRALKGKQASLDTRLQAELQLNHGYALRRMKGDRAALPFYEKALTINRDRRDPVGEAQGTASLGYLYATLAQHARAETLLRIGITRLEGAGALDHAAALFNNLADLYRQTDRLSEAADSYKHALRHAATLGNLQQQAITCASLAVLYEEMNDPSESASWGERAHDFYVQDRQPEKAAEQLLDASETIRPVDLARAQQLSERAYALQGQTFATAGQQFQAHMEGALSSFPASILVPGEGTPTWQKLAGMARAIGEMQAMVKSVAGATSYAGQTNIEASMRQMAGMIASLDLRSAATIAWSCGGLVEQTGANPLTALDPVLSRLTEALPLAASFAEACRAAAQASVRAVQDEPLDYVSEYGEEVALRLPAEAEGWEALNGLASAVLAMLSRSPEGRQRARANAGLLSNLRAFAPHDPTVDRLKSIVGMSGGADAGETTSG